MIPDNEIKPGNVYIATTIALCKEPVVIVSKVDIDLCDGEWNVATLDDIENGPYPDLNIPTRIGIYHWANSTELTKLRIKV
jgi:hypothetical protein